MSNIQDLLKSAITNGVVDPARSAFLLAQASTAIDRLEARLALVEGQRQGAVLVVQQLEARLAEAVDTLRNTGKPVRELLWCLTVWNDHNFTEADLIRKLMLARKGLGLDGVDRVEKANALLAEIDAVTADSAPAVRCTHKFNEWAQCELPAGHDGVHWLTPNSADAAHEKIAKFNATPQLWMESHAHPPPEAPEFVLVAFASGDPPVVEVTRAEYVRAYPDEYPWWMPLPNAPTVTVTPASAYPAPPPNPQPGDFQPGTIPMTEEEFRRGK